MMEILDHYIAGLEAALLRIAEAAVAGDTYAVGHYFWPEMLALGIFFIGHEIYQSLTLRNRVSATVAGLQFLPKEKDLSIICQYFANHGELRRVRFKGFKWPELATGTPVEVDIAHEGSVIAQSPGEYLSAWAGFLMVSMILPFAWHDVTAPDFDAWSTASQFLVTETAICLLAVVLRPFDRLALWQERKALEESACDIVRYEDVSEAHGTLQLFMDVIRTRQKQSRWMFCISAALLLVTGLSWHSALTSQVEDAAVLSVTSEKLEWQLYDGDIKRYATAYKLHVRPRSAVPGSPETVIAAGVNAPSVKAGDTVRVRDHGPDTFVQLDEGVVIRLLETAFFIVGAAGLITGARRIRATKAGPPPAYVHPAAEFKSGEVY